MNQENIPFREVGEKTLHSDNAVDYKVFRIEGYNDNFNLSNIIKEGDEVDIVEFHTNSGLSVTVCTDIFKEE